MGQAAPGGAGGGLCRCGTLGALGEFEWSPEGNGACWPGADAVQGPHQSAASSSAARCRSRLPNLGLELDPVAFEALAGEEALASHKEPREKTRLLREFLMGALRRNRLCSLLDEQDIESLAGALEYHVFETGEIVAKVGAIGTHFFVADTDGLEAVLGGGTVGVISRGQAFGELALLQRCPRSVTVMAVRPGVGVWAADGRLFRRAVHTSVMLRVDEKRTFLDSVTALRGLSPRQLDCVSDASVVQVFSVGERPAWVGKDSPVVYFVKSGRLRVVQSSTESRALEEDRFLGQGSCVCERALLYSDPISMTVEVDKKCELLCVNMRRLRETMGKGLNPIRLQQDFLRRSLEAAGVLGAWSRPQVEAALRRMEFQEFPSHTAFSLAPCPVVVLDGTLWLGSGGAAQLLRRGQCFGYKPDPAAGGSQQVALTAGPSGCRLAILQGPLDAGPVNEEVVQPSRARLVRVLSRVCVFRHLTDRQVNELADGVTVRSYRRGERVFQQGDRSAMHFFVIVEGEAHVIVNGLIVRRLLRYCYFGERALLFDEPRAATIEIASSEGAELWAVDGEVFKKVVREDALAAQQLRYRVWLHDPGIGLRDLEKLGFIGRGTSGVVHLVRHKSSGFKYALKRVSKEKGIVPPQLSREMEVLAESDHPFIMHLVKTLETPDCVFLLSEYLPGGELHAAIRTVPTALTRSQAMFYTGSMVLMLEALHDRNIVYRDLKPENLMLDEQGYLKLIDFGSAKKLESSCLRTFTMVGTHHYMAPEVMRGKGYGMEVDVWALGVILYELVCGYLPFGDNIDNPCEIFKQVVACDYSLPESLEPHSRDLVVGLLTAKPLTRLGCGTKGLEEVMQTPFFSLEGLLIDGEEAKTGLDFFRLLMARKLQPPIPPAEAQEEHSDGADANNKEEEADDDSEDPHDQRQSGFDPAWIQHLPSMTTMPSLASG